MSTFRVPNPYAALPELPALTVSSDNFAEGETLSAPQLSAAMGVEGGEDVSPQLSWSAGPAGTKSYVVTLFDPDAPTASGFWHWSVVNIPASITALDAGVCTGSNTSRLPEGAVVLRNDAGFRGFVGAAPPPGHGPHRYIAAVHAASVETIEVDENSSCAFIGFTLFTEAIARGTLTALYER